MKTFSNESLHCFYFTLNLLMPSQRNAIFLITCEARGKLAGQGHNLFYRFTLKLLMPSHGKANFIRKMNETC